MSFLLNLNTEYHVNDVCFLQIDPMSLTIIHIWVQCYICLNKVILVHACNVQIDIHVYIYLLNYDLYFISSSSIQHLLHMLHVCHLSFRQRILSLASVNPSYQHDQFGETFYFNHDR